MKGIIARISLIVSLVLSVCLAQEHVVFSETYMKVDYCELIKNPTAYDGRKVRVEATYRFGYEWSELYCASCFDLAKRTWVGFDNLDETCSDKKLLKKLRKESPRGRTLSVVFAGTFDSSKTGYGHSNDFKFLLNVSCIEKAKVLFEDSRLPTKSRQSVKATQSGLVRGVKFRDLSN